MMAVLYSPALVLWILGLLGPSPCYAQCTEPYSIYCNIGVINMTADGGAIIRNTVDRHEYLYTLSIEKLIVSSSASGPFLQRVATFAEMIVYLIYREPVFQIPAGNTIADIEIINAETLRSVVAGTNRHLRRLQLEYCMLDRVPPTLSQLIALEKLFITQCAMTAVRLDVFVNNVNLTSVGLARNQIRQIFPITTPPKHRMALTILDLSRNQLERLDMFTFVHLPDLEFLDVQYNHIVRFESTAPVTYSSLSQLRIQSNKLTSFDTRNLTLPSLHGIYLDDNALTEFPKQWGSIPELHYISIDRNNLSQIDMSVFRKMSNITGIFINANQLKSIRTSSPITLSHLSTLLFENNQIVTVNFTGCTFPDLGYLSLFNNLLTAVPPLYQRFPNMRMLVEWNPIKCSSMMTFKPKINESRLYVSFDMEGMQCTTTSSIVLDAERKGCCVA